MWEYREPCSAARDLALSSKVVRHVYQPVRVKASSSLSVTSGIAATNLPLRLWHSRDTIDYIVIADGSEAHDLTSRVIAG